MIHIMKRMLLSRFSWCAMISFTIVVPRLSALFLLALGLCGIICLIEKKNNLKLKDGISFWLFLLAVWILFTSFWAPFSIENGYRGIKVFSLFSFGVFAVGAAFIIFENNKEDLNLSISIGFVLGICVIIIAYFYAIINDRSLWGSYYFDPLTTLNNSAVVIALFSWVALIAIAKYSVRYAVLGFVLTLALLLFLSSMAAAGAILIGVLVLISRRVGGRRSGIFLATIAALLIVSAPNVIKFSGAKTYASPEAQTTASSIPSSTRHRLAMWSFVTEKIDEKPWFGWGFGASRYIPQEDRRLAPNMEIMPLHPHNLALQTRLELGLPGSLILAGLVFSVFYRLATFTDDGWRSGLAMAPAAGWLFVANVSYGMWQSWWIALAFLLAVLMRFALASMEPDKN